MSRGTTVAHRRGACRRRTVLGPNRSALAAAVAVAACAATLFPAAAAAQVWGPYGWYPPLAYAYGPAYSSLRLQISPRETEVFVDGYYAGVVDDFDGFMQRLHVEPGEHTIQLYLNGHRTAEQKIYLQPGGTFRIRHTMEPLAAGETVPPRPAPQPLVVERSRAGG